MDMVRNFKLITKDCIISGIDCSKGGCTWVEGIKMYIAPTLASWANTERTLNGYVEINGKIVEASCSLPIAVIVNVMELEEIRGIIEAQNRFGESELSETSPTLVKVRDYSSGTHGDIAIYTQLLCDPNLYQIKYIYTGDFSYCEDCGKLFDKSLHTDLMQHIAQEHPNYTSVEQVMKLIENTKNTDEHWIETRSKVNKTGPNLIVYKKYKEILV